MANIKATYEHALLILTNPTPLDGGIALLLMDNTLEAAFKLVLDKKDEWKNIQKGDEDFPMILNKVIQTEELNGLREYHMQLITLRKVRNSFQHQGIIPDLNTILNDYRLLTELALKLISMNYFLIKWEDVSLSLLIKSEWIRKIYGKAEAAFTEGDYAAAAAYLIYTFELVKSIARLQIFGSGLTSHRVAVKEKFKDNPLADYLFTLDEEVEVFKLGLNYLDLRNYFDLAQEVGIDSILYEFKNKEENVVINEFKLKLAEAKDDNILKQWYIHARDPILRFVIRMEASWRLYNIWKVMEREGP